MERERNEDKQEGAEEGGKVLAVEKYVLAIIIFNQIKVNICCHHLNSPKLAFRSICNLVMSGRYFPNNLSAGPDCLIGISEKMRNVRRCWSQEISAFR